MKGLVRDRLLWIIAGLFALYFVFPYSQLLMEVPIWGLLAISFNLMFGYAGLFSFGHAALFAIGAYTMGILILHFHVNIFLGILAGSAMSALAAMIVGWISIRRHGVYFALLTLAFNEVIYFTIIQLRSLTGGDDGLRGIHRPDLNFGFWSISLQKPMVFYFFILVILGISVLCIRRVVNSPFGSVLVGIRENEKRIDSVGYNPRYYKIIVFTISGFFAGLAGTIFCVNMKFAALSFAHWSLGAEVMMMSVLGGTGSLYGPLVGAGLVTVMRSLLSLVWDRWLLILGVVFVFSVMFFRGGVLKVLEDMVFGRFQCFGRGEKDRGLKWKHLMKA